MEVDLTTLTIIQRSLNAASNYIQMDELKASLLRLEPQFVPGPLSRELEEALEVVNKLMSQHLLLQHLEEEKIEPAAEPSVLEQAKIIGDTEKVEESNTLMNRLGEPIEAARVRVQDKRGK
jgi:hypothetical protein